MEEQWEWTLSNEPTTDVDYRDLYETVSQMLSLYEKEAEKFCNKVENGFYHPKETYLAFCELLGRDPK